MVPCQVALVNSTGAVRRTLTGLCRVVHQVNVLVSRVQVFLMTSVEFSVFKVLGCKGHAETEKSRKQKATQRRNASVVTLRQAGSSDEVDLRRLPKIIETRPINEDAACGL